jgi:2,4-dienoyl-CoA reductase (NADPH2)
MELPNRLVMSPMENCYADKDGLPSEQFIAYFQARARGGVGLINLGASTIDAKHREVPNSIHFADDTVIEAHRRLTDAVHAEGARIQPQIAHPGPDGLGPILHNEQSIGPSVIQSYLFGNACRALEADEIPAILDLYKAAARRVREAGYDGMELHAAHGYMLLGSFLTPWRNRRTDAYTGETREGRIRLIVETLGAIRSEVGSDFPITLRISGYERIPAGRPIDDTQKIAPTLVEAGVDAFHISGGVIDRLTTQMVTGSIFGDAHNVAAAAAVKRAVDVPVMTVGRIHTPELAEAILDAGDADMIVMGRPMIADPELPAKARSGRASEIRRCISCENCIDSMESMRMRCAVNPFAGRELTIDTDRAAVRKKVVIVGGGPGGLEAARVATLRGHDVALYERSYHLGGALVMASTVHEDNQYFLDYLLSEIKRLGVAIHLGQTMTPERIAALAPDAAIIATGGRIESPRLPGDNLPHVLTGAALRELLCGRVPRELGAQPKRSIPMWQRAAILLLGSRLGRFVTPKAIRRAARTWMPIGPRVAVVGADLAAVELSEFLAEHGRHVAILCNGDKIAPEVGAKRRAEHMDNLERLKISVNTETTVERITTAGVEMRRRDGSTCLVAGDSVILAGEVHSETTLYDRVNEKLGEAYAVGDCTGLGLIRKAVEEGAQAACKI